MWLTDSAFPKSLSRPRLSMSWTSSGKDLSWISWAAVGGIVGGVSTKFGYDLGRMSGCQRILTRGNEGAEEVFKTLDKDHNGVRARAHVRIR